MTKESQLQVRLSAELKAKYQKAADKLGLSLSTLVVLALNDYIKKHQD